MLKNGDSFVIFLIGILLGFGVFIFFLLRLREKYQLQDSQIQPEKVWDLICDHAEELGLPRSNLLFGIIRDITSTEISVKVKNQYGDIVGSIFRKSLSKKRTIVVDTAEFDIEFPLTWKRTAILRSTSDRKILARYKNTGWLYHHQIEIPGFGIIKTESKTWSSWRRYDYKLNGNTIGTSQLLSRRRETGRLTVLPDILPLEIKIFMLAI